MAIQTITYNDKSFINENSGVADINKVKDDDMNEIKTVVNNNATELTNLTIEVGTVNIITVKLPSVQSLSNGAIVPFSTVDNQVGSLLTLSSNQIVIGAGVSYVLVSGNFGVRYNASNSKAYGFNIRLNSSSVIQAEGQKSITEPMTISSGAMLLAVSENDVIDMEAVMGATADVSNLYTQLTVQVVK